MNEKLEMAKNSLYNANEIKDIKENPVVESVLLAPIKAIPVLGDLIDSSTNKLLTINEQIQNIAQKKDTLCRRMYN